jgi:hypothetical protein
MELHGVNWTRGVTEARERVSWISLVKKLFVEGISLLKRRFV